MDVRKTLGNNVLLRFGTRLRALQNVIKILLMGQRGVETHGGKAARSWRAHMGAGRPCVQRGKGRRQPGRVSICPSAPIPPSLSNLLISILTRWLYPFASLLSPRCPALRMPKRCLHCSACCQVGWDAGRDGFCMGKYNKIPSSSRDMGQDGDGGWCSGGTGSSQPDASPSPVPWASLPPRRWWERDWQKASGSGLASFLHVCHCSGWQEKGEKTCGLTENDMEKQPN